jgi:hypothetical protein
MLANKLLGAAKAAVPQYIEDVFSTYLYTGTGADQTITNGISTGNISAFASTSNTTASSIRSGSTLAGFFGSQGVFASFSAGQYLLVDYGTDTAVTQATYRNSVDAAWAPTQVLIQSSPDNSTWTTRATYSDDGSTNLQTITVSGGASARYWRLYQNTATRQNQAGYEWHFGSFTMVATTASANGGMVWIKRRNTSGNNVLFDTSRGAGYTLVSNATDASSLNASTLTSFTTTGFTLSTSGLVNNASDTYASWTFRKQAKFFDVVTWTGNGTGNRTIPHSLGSTPGFIQTKDRDGTQSWWNHHRSVTSPNANWWRNYSYLNGTVAFADWGDDSGLYQSPDATNLYIGSYYNASGKTYVAYLFAHDAGGFGASGSDNAISCGSFTQSSAVDVNVNLGYEPQWLLIKRSDSTSQWVMVDDMRGFLAGNNTTTSKRLFANLANEEGDYTIQKTSTGFTFPAGQFSVSAGTYIYIAIRRPMKTPTSGTSVFQALNYTGSGATITRTTDIQVDALFEQRTNGGTPYLLDRLRRGTNYLTLSSTAAEASQSTGLTEFGNNYLIMGSGATINGTGDNYILHMFRRAPGFFDEVCYDGSSSSNFTVTHNLGVSPELVIAKSRSLSTDWGVYTTALGTNTNWLRLNTTGSVGTNNGSLAGGAFMVVSSSQLQIDASAFAAEGNMVAYLFASVAGVSKVGSYTGNGSNQTINCGFTAGARFVMIKRTDSTGDWYNWDYVRGIVAGNDPHSSYNTSAAQVTTDDTIDPDNSGFIVNQVTATNVNVNAATYIFLAIA